MDHPYESNADPLDWEATMEVTAPLIDELAAEDADTIFRRLRRFLTPAPKTPPNQPTGRSSRPS